MPTRSMMDKMPKKAPEPTAEEVLEKQRLARARLRPPPSDGLTLESYVVWPTRDNPNRAAGRSTTAATNPNEAPGTSTTTASTTTAPPPSDDASKGAGSEETSSACGAASSSASKEEAAVVIEESVLIEDELDLLEGVPIRAFVVAPKRRAEKSPASERALTETRRLDEPPGVRAFAFLRTVDAEDDDRLGTAEARLRRIEPRADEIVAYSLSVEMFAHYPVKTTFPVRVKVTFELLAHGRDWEQTVNDLAVLTLDEELRHIDRIVTETEKTPQMPAPVKRVLRGVVRRPLSFAVKQADDVEDDTIALAVDVTNVHATRTLTLCDVDFYFDPDQTPAEDKFATLSWRWTGYESPPIVLEPAASHRVTALIVARLKDDEPAHPQDASIAAPLELAYRWHRTDEEEYDTLAAAKKREKDAKKAEAAKKNSDEAAAAAAKKTSDDGPKATTAPPPEGGGDEGGVTTDEGSPGSEEAKAEDAEDDDVSISDLQIAAMQNGIVNGTHWIGWTPRPRLRDLDVFDVRRIQKPKGADFVLPPGKPIRDPQEAKPEPRRFFEVPPLTESLVIPTDGRPFNLCNPGAPVPRRFFEPPPGSIAPTSTAGFAREATSEVALTTTPEVVVETSEEAPTLTTEASVAALAEVSLGSAS